MSRLSVFWPEDSGSRSAAILDEPRILPFRKPVLRFQKPDYKHQQMPDVISRARVIYDNRQCRECLSPVVELVQLDDAMVNRQGLNIPGTATLVGFHCLSCDHEWRIEDEAGFFNRRSY
ncbi:MAG: hypothetical protein FJ267_12765 [Planctomycetes bacterium]|nr:hypothetical protein [Planctomycetota bacterium]